MKGRGVGVRRASSRRLWRRLRHTKRMVSSIKPIMTAAIMMTQRQWLDILEVMLGNGERE